MAAHKKLLNAAQGLKFKFISYNKAQPTTKVVKINSVSPVLFFISQNGNISVYNSNMKLVRTHSCFLKEKEDKKPFINNIVYLEDCEKLAVVTTHQKLHFYDISATIFLEEYEITDLPLHPSCLAYRSQNKNSDNDDDASILAIGTECGSVYLFHFLLPTYKLFKKQDQYQVQKLSFKELLGKDHLHLVRVQLIKSIHSATIYQLHIHQFSPRLYSCSRADADTSLAITDIPGKLKTYRFSVESGISCFDLSMQSSIIVTGSSDMIVRVWNVFATRRPVSVLKGHENSVIAVRFIRQEKELISFSRDGVFFLWSVDSWTCLQHMLLPFPAFIILGHKPKFSLTPIFVDEHHIIITCSQWFVQLILGQYPLVNQTKQGSCEVTQKEATDNSNEKCPELELSQLLVNQHQSSTLMKNESKSSENNTRNKKLESDDAQKRIMRRFVADGGPHWALKMHRLEEIDLSQFPTWQEVNKMMMAAAAEENNNDNGGRLVKKMMTWKISTAFKKRRK